MRPKRPPARSKLQSAEFIPRVCNLSKKPHAKVAKTAKERRVSVSQSRSVFPLFNFSILCALGDLCVRRRNCVSFRPQRKLNRLLIPCRPINRSEQFHRATAILAGDSGWALFNNCLEEILDLQPVKIFHRIH